ncbi:MAG: SUMF1/EgtB/PvdO family nonheme iron enzyme [bacterium]
MMINEIMSCFLPGIITILFILLLIFYKEIVHVIEQWINKFTQWFSINVLKSYDKSLNQYLKTLTSQLQEDIIACRVLGEKIDLEKSYISLKLKNKEYPAIKISEQKEYEVEEILKKEQEFGNILMLIGKSGSGKTTILKHLAYTVSLGKGIRHIPVFITITQWVEKNLSLVDYIFHIISKNGFQGTLKFIENKLSAGKFLILLDGFDEEFKKQKEIIEQIETFANHPRYKKNKIIVTSKPILDTIELANFKQFEILELNNRQQRLFLESKIGKESDFDFDRCRELIVAIEQDSKVEHLARNPLLLTFIYHIFKHNLELPKRCVDIYELCTNLMIKRDKELQIDILKNVAYHYHLNRVIELDIKSLLKIIEESISDFTSLSLLKDFESNGIIRKKTYTTYEFIHLTFQEYLVAAYINDNRKDREKILFENIGDYWWEGVILLYAGMSGDASSFIKKVLKSNAEITSKCLLEVETLNNDVRDEVLKKLIETSDGADKELFDKIFESLSNGDINSVLIQGLQTTTDRELRYRIVKLLANRFKKGSKELVDVMKQVFEKDTYGNTLYFAMQILEKIDTPEATAIINSFKGSGKSSVSTQMALIPAGRFLMGSRKNEGFESEHPIHEIHLDIFYMDKTSVTNAEYEKFDPGHERCWEDEGDNHPVVNISWYEAYMYALWSGKRLPTEAEWEKGARGTDGRRYPWENMFDAKKCNTSESKIGKTTPVRKYSSIGESPYGCLDMVGNVLEWCEDWYDENYYTNTTDRNPTGPEKGIFRVLRGGAWNLDKNSARCACRLNAYPDYRSNCVGFRCVRTP